MKLTNLQARHIWLQAQQLNERAPFGTGPDAVQRAIEHLGYVQIDTINVIERAHHHILWARIPEYKISDLEKLQSIEKSIFEGWTHALSYVSVKDFPFFVARMKEFEKSDNKWFASVTKRESNRVLKLIREQGAISIRDIETDDLVDKDHAWASRKPSKRVLEFLYSAGKLSIAKRSGMLKHYELTERHFGWEQFPKPAKHRDRMRYLLDCALRSQGLVSLESITHLRPKLKPDILKLIQAAVKANELIPVSIAGDEKNQYWMEAKLDPKVSFDPLVHILSPFDPLIIQRKRLKVFFNYEHLFEAYLPKEKRKFGYFTLPVIFGSNVVAMLDLKTDRQQNKILIQQWTWREKFKSQELKRIIEEELTRFEIFQLNPYLGKILAPMQSPSVHSSFRNHLSNSHL